MPKKDLEYIECEEILEREETGFLAMCRENRPYCLPFNFFYDRERSALYLHTGCKGIKWEYLTANPAVCFTVAVPGRKRTGKSPCQYTYEFASVIVFGTAKMVESEEETLDSLSKLIEKYREGPVLPAPEEKLAKLRIIRIDVEKITGRQNL